MPLITPNFNFDGCCRAAMELYQRAFDIMKEGGQIVYPPQQTPYSSCFLRLVDRFGFSWVIMTEQREQ